MKKKYSLGMKFICCMSEEKNIIRMDEFAGIDTHINARIVVRVSHHFDVYNVECGMPFENHFWLDRLNEPNEQNM